MSKLIECLKLTKSFARKNAIDNLLTPQLSEGEAAQIHYWPLRLSHDQRALIESDAAGAKSRCEGAR